MAEEVLVKNPSSLYKKCLICYVTNLNYNVTTMDRVQQLRFLPAVVLKDIYAKMSRIEKLKSMLFEQLSDLEIFSRLLNFDPSRQKLFKCLTSLMSSNKPLATHLQNKYIMRYRLAPKMVDKTSSFEMISKTSHQTFAEDFDMDAIGFGMRLGSFFSEAGLLSESINILSCVASRLEQMSDDDTTTLVRLDCLQRLLHSEAALCSFKSAEHTFKQITSILKKVPNEKIPTGLLANVYTQFSSMYFARSEFDSSHKWSVVAMEKLTSSTADKIAIDVLRQAAKSCVVKRDFNRANMLICQATRRARTVFGKYHQKYADTLLDYGFFLLNVDSINQSVNVYKDALEIKRQIFGNRNYHVGLAHEDLSYAYYVHEYSTGNFQCAREHVEKAVDIMKDLVPSDHLMLASAKRVKALLLEEIALDKMAANGVDEDGLLKQSEELHKCALQLSLDVFGEMNVQTAKHYGNLGRLYQTMSRFEEAEQMHQKAIKIKTELLGPYDNEVGLSIGHLASLYSYQMKKYREAEELYLRSIEISLRLFGKSYSGLEYDYLGLCHVYDTLREFEKYLKYASILENWQMLRGENSMTNKPTYPDTSEDISLEEVKEQFFEMSTQVTK
ncbi:amyloid protein-binding protein 2 [Episyrphus balteatus]|uniref:amyloid protein-binding protein 2 n=1 Tax=Episyrphus balteatus TaxID=286459 RepID=UPI00248606C8|nr:amyloid protein-binding protein 2 [Episyrphus balteatus]